MTPIEILLKLIQNYNKKFTPEVLTERHQLIGRMETMLNELEHRREWMQPMEDLWDNEEDEAWNDAVYDKVVRAMNEVRGRIGESLMDKCVDILFLKPHGEDEEYPVETVYQFINRKFYNLEAQIINITMIVERIEDKLRKPEEPTCEHSWGIDTSSTGGSVYKCYKCGAYKYISHTGHTGEWYWVG